MKKSGNEQKRRLAGLKRTPQRLAILDYLDGNRTHPSAEDIYRAVSKKHHALSFATVYNTLNSLAKAGAVRELKIDPERRRYDPDTSMHHHLICISCGKITDVSGEIAVRLPRCVAREYTVVGSHVEFYGYCPACRKNGDRVTFRFCRNDRKTSKNNRRHTCVE